jgi:hypothetical protein
VGSVVTGACRGMGVGPDLASRSFARRSCELSYHAAVFVPFTHTCQVTSKLETDRSSISVLYRLPRIVEVLDPQTRAKRLRSAPIMRHSPFPDSASPVLKDGFKDFPLPRPILSQLKGTPSTS